VTGLIANRIVINSRNQDFGGVDDWWWFS